MKSTFRMICLAAALLLPLLTQAQSLDYLCTFENDSDTADWTLVNSPTNAWVIDSATAQDGSKSLYISNDGGASNAYTNSSTAVSFAYQLFELTAGNYELTYNWKCYGESGYDFIRVFLAPSTATFAAGVVPGGYSSAYNFQTAVPDGWLSLNGSRQHNQQSNWQSHSAEFTVTDNDSLYLVFVWLNDGSGGSNPPGAIDNVRLRENPCPGPINLSISNLTATSFDFSWVDLAATGSWYLEIDTASQAQGTNPIITVNDTFYSFSYLTPATNYTVHVAAGCSSDTSHWRSVTIKTPCEALTTLPLYENFELPGVDTTGMPRYRDCWYKSHPSFSYPSLTNSTSYSHNGGTYGLYWVNATGNYGVYLPLIDTDYYHINQLQLSFWCKASSASYVPTYVIGVVTDILDPESFIPIQTVRVTTGTEWTQITVPLTSYTGPHGFIAVMAVSTTNGWYAYTDEFILEPVPECPLIANFVATRVETGSAEVAWGLRGGSTNPVIQYVVEYDTVGATSFSHSDTVEASPYLINDLDDATDYYVRVRALCDENHSGEWDTITIRTANMPCIQSSNVVDTTVISTGTTTTTGVFVNSSWGNTFSESIFTASELQAAGLTSGRITGITVGYNTAGSYNKELTFFMGNTTRSSFSSVSDMIPVSNLTQVVDPIVRSNSTENVGWVHYEFDTPFYWDGVSNIVMATFTNQYGTSQSSSGFYSYAFSSGRSGSSVYRYKDSSPFTADNCMTTGNSGSANSYLPSITLFHNECIQHSSCSRPMLILTRVELDTVSIQWGAGHHETSWNIYYKSESDSIWTNIPNVTSMQYDFTTFLPQTNYTVRVAPDCGGDSIYAQVQFMTPCLPITTLPFSEDFENFTASSSNGSPITTCWNRLCNSSSSYPYISTSYSHNGTRSIYFYSYNSYYSALITPAFDFPLDTLQVTFAAYKTSASYQIMVGAMTDPTDMSTFVPLDTVSPTNVNEWEIFEVPLNNYTGDGRYIAIAAISSSSNYIYIDDLEITYIPHCPRPNNITIDSVTTSMALLRWNSSATEFIIEYGPYGFAHGDGITLTTTDDSIMIYGLRHSTSYHFYVRGICGEGDTSEWSFVTNLITACYQIDSLPYYENFTNWGVGSGTRPACWTTGGYSSYPYIANLAIGENTYRCLYMYSYASNRVYASLPDLDSILFPINNQQVLFTAMSNTASSSTYSHILIVGVCNIPGDLNTFRPVDTITLNDRLTNYEVDFDTVTSGGRYITFVSTTTNSASYNYVYLTDVRVDAIPSCRRPNHISASNITTNSADIAWNDRNGALSWQMEYGPSGFALGTGTRMVVTSNPYPLTGLTSSTNYDVYVRSICNSNDTSDWALRPFQFSTTQTPAPVPYHYDFETPGEWQNWQTCSSVDNVNWYRDTAGGNGAMGTAGLYTIYISADSGATVSTDFSTYVNVAAYRDFDFGSDPYHTYKLTFRAKVGGSRYGTNIYDGLLFYHVNPSTPVIASGDPLTSPWGSVNEVPRLHLINSSGYWNTYECILDTLTGIHRFAFFWFNQMPIAQAPFIGLPPIIDEVTIVSYECPRPAGLSASNVTSTTADVEWVAPDTGTYRVSCRAQTGGTHRIDTTVNTNQIHLSGLNPGIRYSVQVRRVCSTDDSSALSTQMTFYTLICNEGRNVTLLDSINYTESYLLPLATSSRFSYTQQIFTANELGSAGEISALNFNFYGGNAITDRNNCTIYMGHTSLSSFNEGHTPINPESLTIVHVGQIHTTEGWNRIILNTPFEYDGRSNVVLAICDNSNIDSSQNHKFYVDQMQQPMSMVITSNTNRIPPTAAAMTEFASNIRFLNLRSQCIIEVCPSNLCPLPRLRNALVRTGRVTLRWRNTSDRYIISYRTSDVSSWTVDNLMLTDTFYHISNVYPNTEYTYRVRQYCDSTGISNWAYGTFNTGIIPCLPPEDLRVTNLTNNKVNLAWTPAENNLDFEVHVFNSYFDRVVTSYGSRTMVRGLESGLTYYAAVRANCQGFEEPGEYSDTISFTTPVCPDASNLRVLEVYGNSAVLDWTPGGDETSWELIYGNPGFSIESGISVIANEHPFTLTQLIGSTSYDVYVRSLCASDFPSEHWAGPASFTTLYSDINSVVDDARVHLHPNPTNGDVTLTLPDCASNARVEILDVTGRVCKTIQLEGNGGQHKLSTSSLTAGAYFLRITSDEVNTVKKLIIR